jgi:predicted DNA-binding mobile mystery protein A
MLIYKCTKYTYCLYINELQLDFRPAKPDLSRKANMRSEFRDLRVQQLEKGLRRFVAAKDVPRPRKGWLRAFREMTGITVRAMAKRLGKAPSLVMSLENSEAEYRITLGSLRDAADALGCQLVYALVPKVGSVRELAEQSAREKATVSVRAVEHSMSLEGQAAGGVEEKIARETRRILRRGKK